VTLVSESREESHEGRRFRFDGARRGAFGCHLDITGYGSCEERCGRCFSEPGAMPTSGPHRLTAGVKEYKDVNRLNEFI
jgi:hypothetical protein